MTEKRGAGRPSKYQDQFAKQAAKLCRLGATDDDLAEFFEVDVRTIQRWRNTHDEFCRAIKEAKAHADAQVERALFLRAIGYSHPDDKIFNNDGEPMIVPTTKHYPPDTAAAFIWLKNRRPDQWRDKSEVHAKQTIVLGDDVGEL